ncbi:hypothetical protein [Natrinema pallidum]|uniref:hypothetical protein n=1 Tax=Natrinema pallidum TaxID=69527 RepID=UPI000A01FE18|nr:hypothetical protein [Natrinema pallidum]
MDSTDSGQDIPLPFGRTSTTVDELHTLIKIDKAAALLEENGVTSAEKRIEEFLEAVPSLLAWLRNEGRNFPWRNTTDPWRVYVSEILLQRTRADAVSEVYDDFFDRFPEPAAIRKASEEEIRDSVSSLGFVNHRTRHPSLVRRKTAR